MFNSYLGKNILLALLYIITGKIGLLLAVPPGYATFVWPPSGIAVGFLIIHGYRLWPGILVGSFLLNCYISDAFLLASGVDFLKIFSALVISIGSTFQAIAGRFFIVKFFGLSLRLKKIREVLLLVFVSGPFSCLIAATVATSVLYFSNMLPFDKISDNWLTWWFGDVLGVIIFLPLVLISPGSSKPIRWRGNNLQTLPVLAMFAVLVSLGLTFYAWKIISEEVYQQSLSRFKSLSLESENALLRRLNSYSYALLGGAGFVKGSEFVSRKEWREYVKTIDINNNFPGIKGMGIISAIEPKNLGKFLTKTRRDFAKNFQVHPRATNNDLLYIVKYIEPEKDNIQALGLDISFEKNRLEAANLSRDTGRSVITKRTLLLQDIANGLEFLLLHPFYSTNSPNTVEERRESLLGWVYAPLIVRSFVQDLTSTQALDVNIKIYDGSKEARQNLIYDSLDESYDSKFVVKKHLNIMQQKWLVVWSSTKAYEKAEYNNNPTFVLIGGLLFTALFAMFLMLSVVRHKETMELITEEKIYILPAIIFLVMIVASCCIYNALNLREKSFIKNIVDEQSKKIEDLIVSQTNSKILALKRLGQRWEAASRTSKQEWFLDATNYVRDLEGLEAVAWIDSNNNMPLLKYAQYDGESFGIGSLSKKDLNDALQKEKQLHELRNNGEIIVTEPFSLKKKHKVFAVYIPLVVKGKSDGFMVGIFCVNKFFKNVLNKKMKSSYSISLNYDGKEFFKNKIDNDRLVKDVISEKSLSIYGNGWLLNVVPTKDYVRDHLTSLPIIVLIAGLIITILLTLTVRYVLIARIKSRHLSKSNNLNNAVLGSSVYMIIATDKNGKVIIFNNAAEKSLGYSREEIIGKTTPEIWHDKGEVVKKSQELSKELGRVIKPGFDVFVAKLRLGISESESSEWTFIRKDSSCFPVKLTATSLIDDSGSITGYLGVVEDITQHKLAEENLRVSESRHRMLVDGVVDYAIYWLDIDGNIKSWNRGAYNLKGYKEEEVLGKNFSIFFTKEDQENSLPNKILSDAINKGRFHGEGYRVKKDGSQFWANVMVEPIRNEEGKVIGFAKVSHDETERMAGEQAIKASEETFRSAMEHAPIGMALVRPDGHWLKVNPALCELFGYSEKELLSSNFQTITHPEDLKRDLVYIAKTLEGEIDNYQIEKRYYHHDGSIIYAILNVSLVRDDSGKAKYFISQVQDITKQKEIDRMKNEFISIVSHELRTPLTSIRGSLGLIVGAMSGEISEKANHLIEIAYKNSERLILLINDILDIDKIAAGQMDFDMKEESVRNLVNQAVESNQSYAEKFQVSITCGKIDEEDKINVDATRFIQVLSNLLSNAAKFSPSDGEVLVSATHVGKNIKISVKDFGPGIPEEFQKRIFSKFSQAIDSSKARSKGGTGLGLHITKQITEHMGGNISFETEEGKGTIFSVEFPLINEEINILPDSNNPKILICEDDADIAYLMQTMLKDDWFDSEIASSVAEAKTMIKEKKYAAMTVDLSLPDGNGIDLINELREDPELPHIPVVIVSATLQEKSGFEGGALGIIDWIMKPIDEKRLKRSLHHAIDHNYPNLPKVLHVEDDEDLSDLLSIALSDKLEIVRARTLKESQQMIEEEFFSMVILDIKLPDGSGLSLLKQLDRSIPVLILSASETSTSIRQQVDEAIIKAKMPESEIVETILNIIDRYQSGRK